MLDVPWYQSVLVLVCVWCCWVLLDDFRNRKRWSLLLKLPGMQPRMIFGNINPLRMVTYTVNKQYIARLFQVRLGMSSVFHNSGLFIFWVFRRPLVILTRAATVEPILSSQLSMDKGAFYKMGKLWLGNGLLMSSGEKWRRDRKLLTPTFHFRILDDFVHVMNEQAAVLAQKIGSQAQDKKWLDPQIMITMCTMDIIFETAMGVKIGAQKKPSAYAQGVMRTTDAILARIYRPWLHANSIYFSTAKGKSFSDTVQQLHTFTDALIEKKLQEKMKQGKGSSEKLSNMELKENTTKKKLAFLDLILESDMDKIELRDQINTFIFGGHDTTKSTLSWALYVLGLEQKVQSRLAAEVFQIAGEGDVQLSMDDLKNLKYMDCVIKEVQRLYSPVPDISRMLPQDMTIGGYVIPKGTECIVSISSVHRDPEVFPDPERFDPDRFSPENSVGRHPFAFIPFSAGTRNCIGQRYALMEMKVILCHILRKFKLRSLDNRDLVLEVPEVVLRPLDRLRIQFTPRTSHSEME